MDDFLKIFVTSLFSVITGAFLLWLKQKADPAARLVWGQAHQFPFWIDRQAGSMLVTRSIVIANGGRAPAEDVQVSFAFKPQFFQVQPTRPTTESVDSQGQFALGIGDVGPKEVVTIEMLSFGQGVPLPIITGVRSPKSGRAADVPIMPMRAYPLWMQRVARLLLLVGVATVIAGFVGTAYLIWKIATL